MGKSEEATADATRRSVSRVATPSPTATAVAPCRRQKESTFAEAAREETRRRPTRLRVFDSPLRRAPSPSPPSVAPPRVSGRWTTSTPKTAPVRSTAASLHPVRYAGSTPTTVAAGRIGGADTRARTFAPKSITARRRAASRSDARASRSIAGASNLFTPSATAASTSSNCARGTFDGSNARRASPRVADPKSNARTRGVPRRLPRVQRLTSGEVASRGCRG